jgi:hypothetical protein
LTGPSLRLVPLEARLPSQAIEEAKQKPCDDILLTTPPVSADRDESGIESERPPLVATAIPS